MKKPTLVESTVVIATDGVKELTAKYDSTAEKKFYLIIKDGSGTKSIAINEDLYVLISHQSPL